MAAGSPGKPGGKDQRAWDSNLCGRTKLPAYDALHDQNLRAHYEKRGVRKQLFDGSLIDRVGRILRGNTTKLNIIEQEFANAERDEQRRLREEEYERRKLDARKQYMRRYQGRVALCRAKREMTLQRRQQYASRYFSFLPSGAGSLSGGAQIGEPPRSARKERHGSAASSRSASVADHRRSTAMGAAIPRPPATAPTQQPRPQQVAAPAASPGSSAPSETRDRSSARSSSRTSASGHSQTSSRADSADSRRNGGSSESDDYDDGGF
eukprot:TRINITY_DN28993_c0_g1_i1.p1 TRINITY_DN28993_c0_g1~~TRINITY_DN28993_c0_g1_i1.p1  ORF type:complete len:288 (+),score=88.89 TRINITY_DN28993_c0_g1_i1:68-865(+)